jgi:flavin-dependent dehydrogenase
VNCKLIIDAGGCGAPISKYIAHPPERRIYVNSAQVNAEDLSDIDEDLVELYFGRRYAPGFFGWIIPHRDGSAKIGVAAEGRADIRECFNRFLMKHPIVSSKLRKANFLTDPFYHPIPIGGARERSYVDGILAVGDAASQVKPTTGGGIVLSLICGKLAGKTAAKAIQEKDTSSSNLRNYERAWRRLLGFDLAVMTWIRKVFYGLPDPQLDRMFATLNKLGVDDALSQTADIDFQGRTLLALGRDPHLIAGLLSSAFQCAPSFLHHDGTRGRQRAVL